ncbi:FASCICLIN-LIKE ARABINOGALACTAN PROTEIN 2 [Salix purpurea]|uniref:FASCICLIN-LIKE ARABINOGALACTAN PROTEIN 2 n=2 Tax=Salix TaxID=40685 RepID=A0A9Q0P2Y5_SALPP|nr:FASCICLIN-LIKE ARABINOGALACTAN PROTEIN 2 [Salix purpurea]
MPKYKNLTAPQKVSLLLYHGIPIYQSLQMLKTSNGLMNTLATNGANKYDFTVQNAGEVVTLETKVTTATITGTVKDEEPLVVYKINKVLLPRELFKAVQKAPAPKGAKVVADGPAADAPSDESVDQTADNNGVNKIDGGRLAVVALSLFYGVVMFS